MYEKSPLKVSGGFPVKPLYGTYYEEYKRRFSAYTMQNHFYLLIFEPISGNSPAK